MVFLLNTKSKIKKSFWLSVGVVFSFIFYLFLMKDNIIQVSDKTPRPYKEASYGLGSMPSIFIDYLDIQLAHHLLTYIIFITLMLIGFVFFYRFFNRKADKACYRF